MSAVGKFFKKVGSGIWSGVKKVAGFAGKIAPQIGGLFGPKGAAIGAGIGAVGNLIGGIGKKQEQPSMEGTTDMGMSNQPSFGAPPSMRGDMGGFGRMVMRPAVMPRMGYGRDMSTSGFGGMGGGGMQQEMPAMMPRRRFGGMGMM